MTTPFKFLLLCYNQTSFFSVNTFCLSVLTKKCMRLLAKQETHVQSVGREDPLEKEMATHSSILAWEIVWTEELGEYSLWGCKEV